MALDRLPLQAKPPSKTHMPLPFGGKEWEPARSLARFRFGGTPQIEQDLKNILGQIESDEGIAHRPSFLWQAVEHPLAERAYFSGAS